MHSARALKWNVIFYKVSILQDEFDVFVDYKFMWKTFPFLIPQELKLKQEEFTWLKGEFCSERRRDQKVLYQDIRNVYMSFSKKSDNKIEQGCNGGLYIQFGYECQ